MKNKVSRIVLDTNLWISFLISKDFTKLDDLIFGNKCILIFSEELLQEFLTVAKRPKFRRFFSQNDIEELIETIEEYAEFIDVKTQLNVCRDPKDNFLLSLSQEGQVDYLLTGDKDLLALNTFGSTTILTISDFLK
jgi:putative PIN family toxin of toxin-antitoxin system